MCCYVVCSSDSAKKRPPISLIQKEAEHPNRCRGSRGPFEIGVPGLESSFGGAGKDRRNCGHYDGSYEGDAGNMKKNFATFEADLKKEHTFDGIVC